MQTARRTVAHPTRGWLRAVREALGLSQAGVAAKIGITRQGFSEIEEREARATITLGSLRRAAAAMNCELVYFLLPQPNTAGTFAALAVRSDPAARHLRASEHSMMLEGQAADKKIDDKNIGVLKLVAWLRQNLELYQLITVNQDNLTRVGASEALFAHIQRLAMEAIAVTLCKIYEPERRHELNSIVGVINALPDSGCSDAQRHAAERFAAKHGIRDGCVDPKAFLLRILKEFTETHDKGFTELKTFRDKFAAHSEHNFELGPLPSFDEFEALYGFAYDFYCLVANSFLDIGPALIDLSARNGLLRLMKRLGIEAPVPGFSN